MTDAGAAELNRVATGEQQHGDALVETVVGDGSERGDTATEASVPYLLGLVALEAVGLSSDKGDETDNWAKKKTVLYLD
jgi:hypothetical protein